MFDKHKTSRITMRLLLLSCTSDYRIHFKTISADDAGLLTSKGPMACFALFATIPWHREHPKLNYFFRYWIESSK